MYFIVIIIIIIIILSCQKLGLVGPVQQKIKLPSPERTQSWSKTTRNIEYTQQYWVSTNIVYFIY